MKTAYISLGSNVGDRKDALKQVVERIGFVMKVQKISDVYETYVMDNERVPPYLNCCLEILTDMNSLQLLEFLLEIQGQIPGVDCDMVSFEGEITRTPRLTLPHPDTGSKAYMIVPLAQLNPNWIHPILKKSAQKLAEELYSAKWGTFYLQGKTLLDF